MEKESSKKTNDNNQKKSLRVQRIEEIMLDLNYNHRKDFAHDLDMLPQNFSRDMKANKISEKACQRIIRIFPQYNLEWLLGYSDTKYKEDAEKEYATDQSIRLNAFITVLDTALREVCARDNIPVPTCDFPELLFLECQLRDYAVGLMDGYIHRKNSHVWNLLDNIDNKHGKEVK